MQGTAVMTGIVLALTKYSLTIQVDGVSHTHELHPDADVTINGAFAFPDELREGDSVEVRGAPVTNVIAERKP